MTEDPATNGPMADDSASKDTGQRDSTANDSEQRDPVVRRSVVQGVMLWAGVFAALVLLGVAIGLPLVRGWDVKVLSLPPLFAEFMPRLGPGTLVVVPAAVVLGIVGLRVADRVRWPALLVISWISAVVWMLGLDAVDGWTHLGAILDSPPEYLVFAREVAAHGWPGVHHLLLDYVERIPLDHPQNLPTHIAGHPPAAVLFFVLLVAVGLGSAQVTGLIVTLLAATIPSAVLIGLRALGAEAAGRRIVPFLVTAPAAIWLAVSADAIFAAVAAWAVALTALAAAGRSSGGAAWVRGAQPARGSASVGGSEPAQGSALAWNPALARGSAVAQAGWALGAGLLFGLGTFMNYGFPLIGLVALAILISIRRWQPVPWILLGGLIVTGIFSAAGFLWWEAYPVLQGRYWAGLASARPGAYWWWANIAALICATGPALGAGLVGFGGRIVSRPSVLRRDSHPPLHDQNRFHRAPNPPHHAPNPLRHDRNPRQLHPDGRHSDGPLADRVLMFLGLGAVAMVIAADVSGMSRAEVERIWLFMVPWLLCTLALLPPRRLPALLWANLGFTLVLGHLTLSAW